MSSLTSKHGANYRIEQRDYQADAVKAIFARWEQERSTLLILPTGTGKTVVAAMVAKGISEDLGERLLFLAHREELVYQAATTFDWFGLDCAVEMAEEKAHRNDGILGVSEVVVGTVQSMQGDRLASWDRSAFGVIVTDEAHHSRAKTYKAIYNHFENAKHLGITATPDRGDGKNLGAVYQSIAYDYSLRRAIREGHLVRLKGARLYTSVNLDDIKTTGGDLNEHDLAERISPKIEELAGAIAKEIGDRPTVVFVPDVGCAEIMASALRQMGKAASDISGRMNRARRRLVLDEFQAGDHQVLCCCDLLIEGWDCPKVSCIVICRPTRKRSRYAQMVGRGTRPHADSGKEDCLILDFAWETTQDHELVTAYDLFDDSNTDEEVAGQASKDREPGTATDLLDDLEKAERLVRTRKLQAMLTGKESDYRLFVFDPVGVGDLMNIPLRKSIDMGGRAASEKQLNFLRDLGITEGLTGLSSIGATRRITYLEERRRAGLATVKQVALLTSLGIDQGKSLTLSIRDASDLIEQVLRRKKR